jgi:hypothetical protein
MTLAQRLRRQIKEMAAREESWVYLNRGMGLFEQRYCLDGWIDGCI